MRAIVLFLALSFSGAAIADDLADANAALGARSYPQALQIFSKLAAAGNAEAQLRLGEMHWYGEGVPVDRPRGDALFAQAAASGNAAAAAAAGLSARRALRAKDIAYWTVSYDGADLLQGKFSCTRPEIPLVSTRNNDVKQTQAAINAWNACYNGFIANVADAMPPGKRIPGDILELMSDPELQQARTNIDKAYSAVLATAKSEADAVFAQRDAWNKATVKFIADANLGAEMHKRQLLAEFEINERIRRHSQSQYVIPVPRQRR